MVSIKFEIFCSRSEQRERFSSPLNEGIDLNLGSSRHDFSNVSYKNNNIEEINRTHTWTVFNQII